LIQTAKRYADGAALSTKPSTWRWRALNDVGGPPPALQAFLAARGSLTGALARLVHPRSVGVRLLRQRPAAVASDERRRLRLADGVRPCVREIFLECDGRPWVFAHTVIPPSVAERMLLNLGTRPLGAVLFESRGMRRGAIETVWVPPGLTPYAGLPGGVWGRRSVFRLCRGPLLVSEFFLPPMMRALGLGGGRALAGRCRIPVS